MRRAFVIGVAMTAMLLSLTPSSSADPEKSKLRTIERMYQDIRSEFSDVPAITPERLRELRKDGNVVLVDVRSPKERAVSMIPGAISKEEFKSKKAEYRGKTVVAYCTIGYRSAKFVRAKKKDGISALNLEKSLLGWLHASGSVVDPKGSPTKRVHVYGRNWDLAPTDFEAVW